MRSSLAKGRMGKAPEQWCPGILERLRIVSLGSELQVQRQEARECCLQSGREPAVLNDGKVVMGREMGQR